MLFTGRKPLLLNLLIILLCKFDLAGQKQNSPEQLAHSLHTALIERNENQLKKLLHPGLSYGHSNGWIENKEELIQNNQSKYLVYEKIKADSIFSNRNGNIAVLRFNAVHEVRLKDKSISLNLHVCQVWVKHKGRWKLMVRQSTKL
jgi:hypothetical protein